MAIRISRRYLRGSSAFQADEGEDREGNKETAEASAADLQAGYTSHFAGLVYAQEIMELAAYLSTSKPACSAWLGLISLINFIKPS
jgi:hypothetical protein